MMTYQNCSFIAKYKYKISDKEWGPEVEDLLQLEIVENVDPVSQLVVTLLLKFHIGGQNFCLANSFFTLLKSYRNPQTLLSFLLSSPEADLRVGEVQWGDSGVYICKVVISDDLEGQNEASVELLVLGKLILIGKHVLTVKSNNYDNKKVLILLFFSHNLLLVHLNHRTVHALA